MTSAVIALIVSFTVAMVATPIVRRMAIRMGAVDVPGGRRVHASTTPRLGGLAVLGAFFAPLSLFAVVGTGAMAGFLDEANLVLGLVLGSLVVAAVGALDDIRGVGPWPKLTAQMFAGSIAYASGYRIDEINIPLIGDLSIGLLGLPVTVFWFVAITNAINLIDGLDGLAVGITLLATITNAAIAHANGSSIVVLLSAGLGGSLLGFLRYNFNPATIFLGDSGSMFLGFTLAATSLAGAMTKSSTAVTLLAPIIALGIPILDTLLAMIRRAIRHQSLFAADRAHIHHKLLDLGFTHRRVVLVLYFFSVLLAVAAVAIAFGRSWNVGLALVIVGTILFGLVRLTFRSTAEDIAVRGGRNWNDHIGAQVDAVIAALMQATDEGGVRQALSCFEEARPAVVKVRLLDVDSSTPNRPRGGKRTYELDDGRRKRLVEISFDDGISETDQNQIAARLRAVIEACSRALTGLPDGRDEVSRFGSSSVRTAGVRS